jgi:hypothetical protein
VLLISAFKIFDHIQVITHGGASAVAGLGFRFSGAGWLAQPVLVNGVPGVVVNRHGRPASIVGFTIEGGKIVAIDILADPARVRPLDLAELLN